MLNWFKNNEIERMRLIETGWKLTEKTSDIKVWENETGDILSLNFFNKPPDIPFKLNQINGLRSFYRNQITVAGGGIIKVEVISIKNLPVIECIFKFPVQPSGMLYLGSFTFPFKDKSYVVKIQCPEIGVTGTRDSIIFATFANFDDEDDEHFDPFKGWAKDPYDESLTEGVLMNLSEDEKYDEKFPNHPLSRVRKYLKQIKETISFDDKLFELQMF